jgi:hypothetical protein
MLTNKPEVNREERNDHGGEVFNQGMGLANVVEGDNVKVTGFADGEQGGFKASFRGKAEVRRSLPEERGEGRGVGIRGGGCWIVEGRIDGRNKGILDFREVKEWVDDSGVGVRD